MSSASAMGVIHSVNVSDGGVPKLPVEEAQVELAGLVSDRQAHPRFHGGPERAVSLFGLDVIERLRAEGHPIAPGTTGENLTLAGIDWRAVAPGSRFLFDGGVELEIVSWAVPCSTIRASFLDGAIRRIHADDHPGDSRAYTRVLRPGRLICGERFTHTPPSVARER